MRRFPEQAAQGTLYVGDRPEDQAASRDAGVGFAWAEVVFSGEPGAGE